MVELDADQNCSEALIAAAEHWAGQTVDPTLLAFYRIANLAFRLGQFRLGATMAGDAREQERLTARGNNYALRLKPFFLECSSATTSPLSRVG
jgi:hypothetical protein